MKKVTIALLGIMLVVVTSCKKAEKIEVERPTNLVVSTFVGSGLGKLVDGKGQQAAFRGPQSLVTDAAGNIYVADMNNHSIRKITSEGVVTTLAGNGERGYLDGTGAAAKFNNPIGIALDANGNIYVADSGNSCIRKITSSGVVSTLAGLGGSGGFADGTGAAARFNYPSGIVVDGSNNIFVADQNNHRIRKITSAGMVTTFAGNGLDYFQDGTLETATMMTPYALAFDPSGNMYVAQASFIRKITPQGIVSLFAGNSSGSAFNDRGIGYINGAGLGAKFYYVASLVADKKGNLYVADSDNNIIRKITPDGFVSNYAGIRYLLLDANSGKYTDGLAAESYFNRPQGITIDKEGNIIVSENDGNRIRKISEVPIPDSPDEITRKNWNNPVGWK